MRRLRHRDWNRFLRRAILVTYFSSPRKGSVTFINPLLVEILVIESKFLVTLVLPFRY